MFGRKKDSQSSSGSVRADSVTTETPSAGTESSDQQTSARYTPPKGKPTPSRKQQEAARRQPLVPADRKAAKEADRQAMREQRMKENIAMQTGDERFLPARDKGAQRRFVRDHVDARFNLGDFMLIIIFLIFIAGFLVPHPLAQQYSVTLMWLFFLLVAVDMWLLWRGLKKKLSAKFGQIEPGTAMYAINRAMMIRRFRLPKPQVKRGNYPH